MGKSGGHERGAGPQFLLEFCDLSGFGKPAPPVFGNEPKPYTFERRTTPAIASIPAFKSERAPCFDKIPSAVS
jgi:hypothetical protein